MRGTVSGELTKPKSQGVKEAFSATSGHTRPVRVSGAPSPWSGPERPLRIGLSLLSASGQNQ